MGKGSHEYEQGAYTKQQDKRACYEHDYVDQGDGVLSSLLELYGSSTIRMAGPSASATSNASARSTEDRSQMRSRSFIGRRMSLSSVKSGQSRHERKHRREEIVAKLASVLERQNFILKLTKALLKFGSPSHRLEDQLHASSLALRIEAQFLHLPLIVMISFGDAGTRTSETHFVKADTAVDLGRLHLTHEIHRRVSHAELSVADGTIELSRLIKAKPIRRPAELLAINGLMGAILCLMGFAGSIIDAVAAGIFNLFVAAMQIHVAGRNPAFNPIFEISMAMIVSFFARALATSGYWCYNSLVSAGLVSMLPGMPILMGALELGSRKIITGSVKIVYAIIFSLFLGFGIVIGSDVYFLFNPYGRTHTSGVRGLYIRTEHGDYDLGGKYTGRYTFTNSTLLRGDDAATFALAQGQITCHRDPGWPWWRQPATPYFLLLWVPVYAFLQCVKQLQPIRSKDMIIMWVIACVGFVANMVANRYIFKRSDVTSFMGAFTVSLLGGLNARLLRGTAFTSTVPGILFLVPGGIAAAGGLSMTANAQGAYPNGIQIGLRMIQTAIGIVVGVFAGAFVIYGIFKRKGHRDAIYAW